MTDNNDKIKQINTVSENLYNFSIDQNDLKSILKQVPEDDEVNMVSLEYEIQLLKIVTVGWSISFFMELNSVKTELGEEFWKHIHEFSKKISSLSSNTTGKEINYFSILNERLKLYLDALKQLEGSADPSLIVGYVFAEICKHKENRNVIETGQKIFNATIMAVKTYLDSIEFIKS